MHPEQTKWDNHSIRELEWASIYNYVDSQKRYLRGNVLDYGAGTMPYRDIVEGAGGNYHPYDRANFPAANTQKDLGPYNALGRNYDSILCTQVVQYVPYVPELLQRFYECIHSGGFLVMTYPTNWDEVQPEDLHRFTKAGMTRLLEEAGFRILTHVRRAEIELGGFKFPLGYGVTATY